MIVSMIPDLYFCFCFCFQGTRNSDGSDSEDYDLDADLQEVQGKDAGQDSAVKSLPGNTTESSMPVRKKLELKNNNNSSVTAKLQGLLDKIKPSTVHPSKTKATDDDDDDDSEDEQFGDTEFGEGSEFHGKESSKSKPQNDSDEDDSESDEDKIQYRSEMLKQAMSDFYKGQSTVSFLRRFIYSNGK